MSLELHLRIAGLALFALAAIHPLLPARLDWRQDLSKLTLLNRQIFIVHTLFIVLMLVLFAALCWFYAAELAAPGPLARAVLGGLTVFWGLRLVVQLGVYDRSLWRGHPRNTAVHVGFTLLWTYLTAVFAWGFWRQLMAAD